MRARLAIRPSSILGMALLPPFDQHKSAPRTFPAQGLLAIPMHPPDKRLRCGHPEFIGELAIFDRVDELEEPPYEQLVLELPVHRSIAHGDHLLHAEAPATQRVRAGPRGPAQRYQLREDARHTPSMAEAYAPSRCSREVEMVATLRLFLRRRPSHGGGFLGGWCGDGRRTLRSPGDVFDDAHSWFPGLAADRRELAQDRRPSHPRFPSCLSRAELVWAPSRWRRAPGARHLSIPRGRAVS